MPDHVKSNSVIQITELGPEGWVGCLAQVDEVKGWGVVAWVRIPKQGEAYIRLNKNQYQYIGEAVLLPRNEKEF